METAIENKEHNNKKYAKYIENICIFKTTNQESYKISELRDMFT